MKIKVLLGYCILLLCVMAYPLEVSAADADPAADELGDYDCSHDEEIKNAIRNAALQIDVTGFGITEENRVAVRNHINRTFHDLCSSPRWLWRYKDSKVTTISFQYNENRKTIREKYKLLALAKDQALSVLSPDMSQLEKALAMHDYIASVCAYDYENYLKEEAGEIEQLPPNVYTAYGVLVDHTAVCGGYAKAYAYLMQQCSIPCYYVRVDTEQRNHAWNLIQLDGEWYFVDVTADDPSWDRLGRVKHDWFLVSEETMLQRQPDRTGFDIIGPCGNSRQKASDPQYENGFWKQTQTQMHYYKNRWYYMDSNSFTIYEYNPVSGTKKSILHKKKQWNGKNYAKTAAFANDFYYSTPYAVWRLDLESGIDEKIFETNTGSNFIYEFGTIGSELYYYLSKSYNDENAEKRKVYSPVGRSIAHAGTDHEWVKTVQFPAYCNGEGTIYYSCKKAGCSAFCMDRLKKEEDSHDYKKRINQASYRQDGLLTWECADCGDKKEETIPGMVPCTISNKLFDYNEKIQRPIVTVIDTRGNKIQASNYTISYDKKESKNPGKYVITITFFGNYRGVSTRSYYIRPPKAASVAYTATNKAFTVKWKAMRAELADDCEIRYFAADDPQNKKTDTKRASAARAVVKKLKPDTKYYVQIRTCKKTENGVIYSNWSEWKEI